jgi:hypothetical protein
MKTTYNNFEMERIKGTKPINLEYFASIDVTTEKGFLFCKIISIENKIIYKKYGGRWIFIDTGIYTNAFEVESLENSYIAIKSMNS